MDFPFERPEIRSRLVIGASLILTSAFPIALLAVRVKVTEGLDYSFLVWNMFLAWVPLAFALLVEYGWRRHWRRRRLLVGMFAWLVFFPNAPYLVTDLIHLPESQGPPLWFDALILMAIAIAGLLVGFVSLYVVQLVVAASFGRIQSWVTSLVVLGLSGFGIYLGRFARLNTWDVLSRPGRLVYDIGSVVVHPMSNKRAIAISALFASFLVVTFAAVVALGQMKLPERDLIDSDVGERGDE